MVQDGVGVWLDHSSCVGLAPSACSSSSRTPHKDGPSPSRDPSPLGNPNPSRSPTCAVAPTGPLPPALQRAAGALSLTPSVEGSSLGLSSRGRIRVPIPLSPAVKHAADTLSLSSPAKIQRPGQLPPGPSAPAPIPKNQNLQAPGLQRSDSSAFRPFVPPSASQQNTQAPGLQHADSSAFQPFVPPSASQQNLQAPAVQDGSQTGLSIPTLSPPLPFRWGDKNSRDRSYRLQPSSDAGLSKC